MFLLKEEKPIQPTAFDETHLDVKLTHGRSQLQELRVVHSWATQTIKVRLPKLTCQWYNKTESSMQLIPGVTEDSYQPSIIDVGTSIYVQVMPESKELEYEGMPITRMSSLIQLAAETEEQAKDLLEAGKSTFFVELKELYIKGLKEEDQEPVDGKVPIRECLLKVVRNKLLLIGKAGAMEKADVLLSGEIGEQYPQLQIDRTCGRFLNVLFNAEEYAIVILQNNKIRDVLYLLTKSIQEKNAQTKALSKSEQKVTEAVVVTPIAEAKDNNQNKVGLEESLKKSEESLPLSPQTIQKQSNQSANIIIIAQLRSKLAKSEHEHQKSIKQAINLREKLNNVSQQNSNLSNDLLKTKQLLLKVEEQLKSAKAKKEKQMEEMCYLKNQCRLLEESNELLSQETKAAKSKFSALEESSKLSEDEKRKFGRFSSLKLQDAFSLIMRQEEEINEYRLKNQYLQAQIEKHQEEGGQARAQLEQLEASNKHLKRKVQSLMEAQSKIKPQVTVSANEEEVQALNFIISKQKQEQAILLNEIEALKKEKTSIRLQVKDLIEENTCLRSKEKSSKHELKLEVVELKKLMHRFTEMITEKDVELESLKLSNKTLNKALLEHKK